MKWYDILQKMDVDYNMDPDEALDLSIGGNLPCDLSITAMDLMNIQMGNCGTQYLQDPSHIQPDRFPSYIAASLPVTHLDNLGPDHKATSCCSQPTSLLQSSMPGHPSLSHQIRLPSYQPTTSAITLHECTQPSAVNPQQPTQVTTDCSNFQNVQTSTQYAASSPEDYLPEGNIDITFSPRSPSFSELGMSNAGTSLNSGELVTNDCQMPNLSKAEIGMVKPEVENVEMPVLEKAVSDLSNQCLDPLNNLDSHKNPDFPVKLFDLSNRTNPKKAHQKRKLWLQNLLQLRDNYGEGLLFLNGKVIWKDPPNPTKDRFMVDPSEEILVKVKIDSVATTSPLSKNSDPPMSNSSTEERESVRSVFITPNSGNKETTLSNIKSTHKELKTTDLRSKLDNSWYNYQNVKRKLTTTDLNSSSDSIDPNRSNISSDSINSIDFDESNQQTAKKDSRHHKHKNSTTCALRRPASESFDTDYDTSRNYSDLDSSFDHENTSHSHTVESVNRRVKKLKIQESDQQRCEELVPPEEEEDVYYQLMMLNMEENSDHTRPNKISSRKCKVCGETERNLKRHTIYEHLTDVWWGVVGDATCWKCQAYHSLPDITFCDGFYIPQRDYRSLITRHAEFFDYLKDDLDCTTDKDLVELVNREGLSIHSLSPFSNVEINFMRDIDGSKGLTTNHIYSAQHPSRVTELLHWRTLSEIFSYVNLRGRISSEAICIRPIKYVDCYCNVIALYKTFDYRGPLANLPILTHSPSYQYLHKVITDITEPALLFSPWSQLLFNDRDIKISMGIHPKLANYCSAQYLTQVESLMTNPSVVAVGGVGLDGQDKDSMEIQISVFSSFLKIAARHYKTLRLASTGAHTISMHLLKTNLTKMHMVHFLNFNGSINEAEEFMDEFPNGYFGISKESCITNPYTTSLVRQIPLDRLLPGSNAPFNRLSSQPSLPVDTGEVIHLVAQIKVLPVQTVAKQFRYNTTLLYGV